MNTLYSTISTYLFLLILMSMTNMACDTATGEIDEDLAVIEAFLFAGEPVDNIRVTSTIPFNSTDTVAVPINDARMRLIRGDIVYELDSRDNQGFYHYPGDDLVVEPGDHFMLEMDYLGQTVYAETDVPPAPLGVELDSLVLEVPTFGVGQGRPQPGGPGGGRGFNNSLLVTWENTENLLHYVVVNGLQDEHESIFPDFIGQRIGRFRFISEPTLDNFFEINLFLLEGLGSHEVRVYRVNQEYADLYNNREQDSRDLNEPPDNINGALGIFSAFNSIAIPFEVKHTE